MSRLPARLTDSEFDLMVVGAGIHGACVARDAASRGLSVALIERDDLGGATSHNSLKILHGGIRYLQHADLGRLRSSVRERRAWMNIAPHLTRPIEFVMPTYGMGTRGRPAMACAFTLYNLLSRDRNQGLPATHHIGGSRTIGRRECMARIPDLDPGSVSGGAVWADGQVLDADRALLDCVRDASDHGAVVATYCEVVRLGELHDGLRTARVRDTVSGEELEVRGRLTINAAGPWIDDIVARGSGADRTAGEQALTQAMNLVVDRTGPEYAIGMPGGIASDSIVPRGGRLFFATPWRGRTVIGTSHWPVRGTPKSPPFDEHDIQRFLDEYRAAYPRSDIARADVLYAYAGHTHAEDEGEDGSYRRSRRSLLLDHAEEGLRGVLSVRGVKWTTARQVAQDAVDWAAAQLPDRSLADCATADRSLPSAQGHPGDDALRAELGLEPAAWERIRYHGVHARALCTDAESRGEGREPLLHAAASAACSSEWVTHLDDLVLRRLHAYFGGTPSREQVAVCADVAAELLGWDGASKAAELQRIDEALGRHCAPRSAPDLGPPG